MSNEYKDYYDDLYCEFEDRVDILDNLPDGWVSSFIPTLKEELFNMLGSYVEDFEIMDAKEKWGELRVAWCWSDREYSALEIEDMNELCDRIEDMLEKYMSISRRTCAKCGKRTVLYSSKYELPICDECGKDF